MQRSSKRTLQGMKNKLVNRPAFTKPHFRFRRMHIDVDTGWIKLEKQHIGRMARAMQNVRPRFTCGMGEQLVANKTAINEEVLFITSGARISRQGGESG